MDHETQRELERMVRQGTLSTADEQAVLLRAEADRRTKERSAHRSASPSAALDEIRACCCGKELIRGKTPVTS